MKKITLHLTKYFLIIITLVVFICFIGSSIFLSRFYINQQYKNLKKSAEDIYSFVSEGTPYANIGVNAILVKQECVYFIGRNQKGFMNFLSGNMNFYNLAEKGTFKSKDGEEFIYYRHNTKVGDIIVFQNKKDISGYLNLVYLVLISVFLVSILICIPIVSFLGTKFTKPILKLQKASDEIANGNFKVDTNVRTADEIEDLAHSIDYMASSLEKKYTLQSNFIANVSHDFRTPLSIIRNYSEAIIDGIVDEPIQKEYSMDIINEVDKLSTMVTDLLQLSKLKESSYAINISLIEVNKFLEKCKDKFVNISHGIVIEFESDFYDTFAYFDENLISRVLYNFIENAIKYSETGGKVKIAAKRIDDNGIKISIFDNGNGISKEMLEDIWNRYYKDKKSGGMGLGLAIASEILKLHGFSYGVNSEPDVCTEFYFVIPKESIKN